MPRVCMSRSPLNSASNLDVGSENPPVEPAGVRAPEVIILRCLLFQRTRDDWLRKASVNTDSARMNLPVTVK